MLRTYLISLMSPVPPATWKWMWPYAIVTGALLVGAIALAWLPLAKGTRDRLAAFAWTNFFFAAVLFFSRQQRLPYLGSDLLRLIQEAGMAVWLGLIVYYQLTVVPKERASQAVAARKAKYLPHA